MSNGGRESEKTPPSSKGDVTTKSKAWGAKHRGKAKGGGASVTKPSK